MSGWYIHIKSNTDMNQVNKTLFKISAAISVLFLNIHPSAGWGQIGHSTIAQVAQDHLTPKAERALDKYLDGLKLAIIASDADVRPLLFSQLRDGGYRLAAIFNEIFR